MTHEAYAVIVRRHQDELYRHARGMGLDHDTSLDLVQDAFVRGYTHISDCRQPENIRPWLFRILRNLCMDHFKNVRRSTLSLDDIGEVAQGASTELSVTLEDALMRLPLSLREAFLLKHDAGYTYEEIAEMTSSSESAVKMRVHRAREALRGMLMDRAVA